MVWLLVNKWSVLDKEYVDPETGHTQRVFDPHPAQLEMMEDPARFLVASCGRRLGKSKMVASEFLPEVALTRKMATWLRSEGKRREFWTVGPEYTDAEKPFRVFWNLCRKLEIPMDKPGSYYSLASKEMTVSLWNGTFIYRGKSAKYPDQLVGEALSGVHIEEAAKLKESVWTQMLMPSLADFKGWAKFTSTPEGKNWFYQLYIDSIRANNLGWSGHRIPSWRNPYVYHEPTVDRDVKTMLQTMVERPDLSSFEVIKQLNLTVDSEIAMQANNLTIPMFQQEIAADFTDFVGKVFKEFDEETHTRPLPFNPNWETIAAVDYGYRNPNVWLLIQIGPWGEINVVDELYQENLAPDEFAQEILRRGLCPDIATEFYPDPASPGDTKVLEGIFRRNGKRIRARPHTGGKLDNRLNLIRLAFKNRVTDTELNAPRWTSDPPQKDLTRPQLMISTRCTHTIYEMSEYRYPATKNELVETSTARYELPMKKDDHTPEALGRFLAGKFHSMAAQHGGGARVSQAKFLNGLGSKRDHPGGYDSSPAGIHDSRTSRRIHTGLGQR